MINYVGTECPVCKNKIKINEDIVVCPKCGTPHHRECYNNMGHCAYDYKHDEEYIWKKEINDINDGNLNNEENLETKICPRCKKENAKDATFCSYCGAALLKPNVPYGEFSGMPFVFDPMAGVDPKEDFDGVSAEELSKYVKNNTPYYMIVFKRIKDKISNRFNFSAFLFTGGWLLYRKQYKLGAIVSVIMASIYFLSFYVLHTFNYDIINNITDVSSNNVPTLLSFEQMADRLMALPLNQWLLFFVPYVLELIRIFIIVFLGFNANKIYYKHCVSDIKKIKSEDIPKTEINNRLEKRGGVNSKLAIFIGACYLITKLLMEYIL